MRLDELLTKESRDLIRAYVWRELNNSGIASPIVVNLAVELTRSTRLRGYGVQATVTGPELVSWSIYAGHPARSEQVWAPTRWPGRRQQISRLLDEPLVVLRCSAAWATRTALIHYVLADVYGQSRLDNVIAGMAKKIGSVLRAGRCAPPCAESPSVLAFFTLVAAQACANMRDSLLAEYGSTLLGTNRYLGKGDTDTGRPAAVDAAMHAWVDVEEALTIEYRQLMQIGKRRHDDFIHETARRVSRMRAAADVVGLMDALPVADARRILKAAHGLLSHRGEPRGYLPIGYYFDEVEPWMD